MWIEHDVTISWMYPERYVLQKMALALFDKVYIIGDDLLKVLTKPQCHKC